MPAERGAEERPTTARVRPVRSRALRLASRRPLATALGTGLLLIVAASGLLRIEVGQTLIRGLPADEPARAAYAQAAGGFAPGVLAPTVVLVEAPGLTRQRPALRRLQAEIAQSPGVALVVGPAQQRSGVDLGAVYARTADAVRYLVVFDAGPLGAGGISRLAALRARLPGMTERSGLPGVRTLIAGDTALAEETVRLTAVGAWDHRLRVPRSARPSRADLLRPVRRGGDARRPRFGTTTERAMPPPVPPPAPAPAEAPAAGLPQRVVFAVVGMAVLGGLISSVPLRARRAPGGPRNG